MPERTRPTVDLATTCACGAVGVTVRGTIYSMLMCSCEDCQKATGTGHSTLALVDPSAVTVTGETRSFARPSASGATFTRTFCPACGTPLYGRSSRAERTLALPIGLFGKDTAWFDPTQLIFSRSHRDWDSIASDLPRHATYRERRDG
jgi:hypothetical protein